MRNIMGGGPNFSIGSSCTIPARDRDLFAGNLFRPGNHYHRHRPSGALPRSRQRPCAALAASAAAATAFFAGRRPTASRRNKKNKQKKYPTQQRNGVGLVVGGWGPPLRAGTPPSQMLAAAADCRATWRAPSTKPARRPCDVSGFDAFIECHCSQCRRGGGGGCGGGGCVGVG